MERPDLADELTGLAKADLSLRQQLLDAGELQQGYHPAMRAMHRRHGDRFEAILDDVGCWPGFGLVGVEGSEAAFLIAQHDIANPQLIRRSRQLYAKAVERSDADPRCLAKLEDRIRYFEGRLQRYGTHVGWNELGEFGPWPPLEDPDRVDIFRHELGLEPLSVALANAAVGRARRRPVADVLREHSEGFEFARQVGWLNDTT